MSLVLRRCSIERILDLWKNDRTILLVGSILVRVNTQVNTRAVHGSFLGGQALGQTDDLNTGEWP